MESINRLKRFCLVFFIFIAGGSEIFALESQNPKKCILVFGAHADDVESLAGGTFAKYIAQGYQGIYVVVTNNTAGCLLERPPGDKEGGKFTVSRSPKTYPLGPLETMQIRAEESRQAAHVYGAIPIFLDFRETWFWQGRKQCYIGSDEFHNFAPPKRQIVSVATRLSEDINVVYELLKKYQPEIVIIHTLGGEKHDHGNSAYIMYQAFKKAMEQNIPVGKLWMRARGWLLDEEARKYGRGRPDVQIDVKDYLEIKYRALNKHISQNGGDRGKYLQQIKATDEVIEEFITVFDNTN